MTNEHPQSTERRRLMAYNCVGVFKSGFFLKAVAIDLAGTWNKSKPGSWVSLICVSALFLLLFWFHSLSPPHDAAVTTPSMLAMKSAQWRSISLLWLGNKAESGGKVGNECRWEGDKDRVKREAWPRAMESCNRCYVSSRRIKRVWAFIWN